MHPNINRHTFCWNQLSLTMQCDLKPDQQLSGLTGSIGYVACYVAVKFSHILLQHMKAIPFVIFPSPSKLVVLEVADRALSFTWLSNNNMI